MSGIEDYRTPEELRAQRELVDHVQAVLNDAVQAGGALVAAMQLGEPQAVIELWTNRLWVILRDNLDGEDRLRAIVELLTPRMNEAAKTWRGEVR